MPRYQRILGKILATPIVGVFAWVVGGAIIWAVGGMIFGVCCGAISALVHAEPWRVVTVGVYSALCGGTAGSVLGAIRATFDRHEDAAWSDEWETNSAQGERVVGADIETLESVETPVVARRRFSAALPIPGSNGTGKFPYLQH